VLKLGDRAGDCAEPGDRADIAVTVNPIAETPVFSGATAASASEEGGLVTLGAAAAAHDSDDPKSAWYGCPTTIFLDISTALSWPAPSGHRGKEPPVSRCGRGQAPITPTCAWLSAACRSSS
jgi:hypothetical protein